MTSKYLLYLVDTVEHRYRQFVKGSLLQEGIELEVLGRFLGERKG